MPGISNDKAPYLSTFDLFSEKLVQLPYEINDEKFETIPNQGNLLLPIKPIYFDFFTIDDLKNNLSVVRRRNKIIFSLKIPVRGNTLIAEKAYTSENILNGEFGHLGLGIFPFYKIETDSEEDLSRLNEYSVMLMSDESNEAVSLNFYKYSNIEKPIESTKTIRSTFLKTDLANTAYYAIKENYFDFALVELGNAYGLIVPKFTPITTINRNNAFLFSIDFGTSNTHIAFGIKGNPTVQSLSFDRSEQQTVFLNKKKSGIPRQSMLGSFFNGVEFPFIEFSPEFIGTDSNLNYPIKTAICQSPSFPNGADINLFGEVNVAYHIYQVGTNNIHTDLKWKLEENHNDRVARARVEAFFKQHLWLLKNKILLNDGNVALSKIIWFIPTSMSPRVQEIFQELWESALNQIFKGLLPKEHLMEEFESIAPYYALQQNIGFQPSQNVLNIDIGGGTTDVLLVARDKDKFFRGSFRFAGDDIWGDGILSKDRKPKDNGFVKMMEQHPPMNLPKEIEPYQEYFNSSKYTGSGDICGFMFQNDEHFKFTDRIRDSGLKGVLVIHLGAIIYYLSNQFKSLKLPLPEVITFTGKGSEYVKLIHSRDSKVKELMKYLWEEFSGQKLPSNFNLKLSSNPKVLTAEGGVLRLNMNRPLRPRFIKPIKPRVRDIDNLSDDYIKYNKDFIDKLFNENLIDYLEDLGVDLDLEEELINELKEEWIPTSFRQCAFEVKQANTGKTRLSDALFFWGLKNSLYELSKKLV